MWAGVAFCTRVPPQKQWHPSHGYVNNWDGARGEYFRDYKQA